MTVASIEAHVVRVEVHTDHLIVKLARAEAADDQKPDRKRFFLCHGRKWHRRGDVRS